MTYTKHTPGPWRYAPTNTETVSHLVRCPEGYAVAKVLNSPLEANAHLIAAAPDLLAALKSMITYCNAEPGTYAYPGTLAASAIAKAEDKA